MKESENNMNNLANNESPEIHFKESFVFRLNTSDYKFYFSQDKNNVYSLVYFKLAEDEQEKKVWIKLEEMKDFIALSNADGRWKGIIQIKFKDHNKNPLELNVFDKNDYDRFVGKLANHVKRS